jgi:hypothetical protein
MRKWDGIKPVANASICEGYMSTSPPTKLVMSQRKVYHESPHVRQHCDVVWNQGTSEAQRHRHCKLDQTSRHAVKHISLPRKPCGQSHRTAAGLVAQPASMLRAASTTSVMLPSCIVGAQPHCTANTSLRPSDALWFPAPYQRQVVHMGSRNQ